MIVILFILEAIKLQGFWQGCWGQVENDLKSVVYSTKKDLQHSNRFHWLEWAFSNWPENTANH